MKTKSAKFTMIVFLAIATASSLHFAVADDTRVQGKLDANAVETFHPELSALSLNILPEGIECEGYIDYGTNPLTFVTHKVVRGAGVFDGQNGKGANASTLHQLMKERDQLKERLREVEALIEKSSRE